MLRYFTNVAKNKKGRSTQTKEMMRRAVSTTAENYTTAGHFTRALAQRVKKKNQNPKESTVAAAAAAAPAPAAVPAAVRRALRRFGALRDVLLVVPLVVQLALHLVLHDLKRLAVAAQVEQILKPGFFTSSYGSTVSMIFL
jgi:hypothetical protein